MKRLVIVSLLLLVACAPAATPSIVASQTSFPTSPPPTRLSTSTTEPLLATYTPPPPQTSTLETTTARVSPVDSMPQVYIPAGTFRMGGLDVRRAPNEIPVHDVTLDAFWMDQLEVTNAMYGLCVSAGECTLPQSLKSQRRPFYFTEAEFKDFPVIYVTWGQASTYCRWAGRRLPTEAEWERAGRGDDFRTFPWGEDKADGTLANFNMLVGDTSRVGSYPAGASPFGVLDLAGNVAEWVNDLYSASYANAGTLNPPGPAAGGTLLRVVRGGSLGDAEINIRVSKRSAVAGSSPGTPADLSTSLGEFSPRIGFRCAQDD